MPSLDASSQNPEQAGSSCSSAAGGYHPNAYLRNPSFSPSRILQREGPRSRPPPISIEWVEAAVAKAQRDLLAAGQSVSAWRVSQAAALALQVVSWGSLGLNYHDVPTLRQIQSVEGKVCPPLLCSIEHLSLPLSLTPFHCPLLLSWFSNWQQVWCSKKSGFKI